MTYLPNPVFNNILSYCDDRIEQNQKINLGKCLTVIKHLKLIADFESSLEDKRSMLLRGCIPNLKRPGIYINLKNNLDFREKGCDCCQYDFCFYDLFQETSRYFLGNNYLTGLDDGIRPRNHIDLLWYFGDIEYYIN